MSENKISVVINTYNAERFLREVLRAVKSFDEVVVCDMESTDQTVSIASEEGCRVVTFPKGTLRIVEPARNFALQQAANEWVLVVDADEIVTPELRNYLYQRVNSGGCPEGLFIPRRNLFIHRHMHASPDYQLRFLRRDCTRWPETIHSIPQVEGRVERIPTSLNGVYIDHLADETVSEMLEKNNRYTDYEVVKKQSRHYSATALLLKPLWAFLRSYFLQGALRDGRRGLIRSGLKAFYQFTIIAKVTELHLNQQDGKQ